jgi:hypothetical protein
MSENRLTSPFFFSVTFGYADHMMDFGQNGAKGVGMPVFSPLLICATSVFQEVAQIRCAFSKMASGDGHFPLSLPHRDGGLIFWLRPSPENVGELLPAVPRRELHASRLQVHATVSPSLQKGLRSRQKIAMAEKCTAAPGYGSSPVAYKTTMTGS